MSNVLDKVIVDKQTFIDQQTSIKEAISNLRPTLYLASIVKTEASRLIEITDESGVTTSFEYGGGTGASMISVTYEEIVNLKNSSALIKGAIYRITDYQCTTSQGVTQSANHVFDIIVVADDANKLNENARACLHDGDTYFANSKLEAWELKYSLDNDTNRFTWADSANGKGVIYYMKDEFNNECPYDFKNIQFKRKLTNGVYDPTSGTDTWCYTFNVWDSNVCKDFSVVQTLKNCYGNQISFYITSNKLKLNDNVFINSTLSSNCYSNTFENGCYSNTFGNYCTSNTFGKRCYANTFGNSCYYNIFGNYCYSNTFGNGCYSNIFGNYCSSNTFGNYFVYNTLRNSCYSNTFGNNCQSNSFVNNCDHNTFADYCQSNSFVNNCSYNIFGNYCSYNIFGNASYYNTFGNYCYANTFGNGCTTNKLVATGNTGYAQYNIFENGVQYVDLQADSVGSSSSILHNITIRHGVMGMEGSLKVITAARELSYGVTYSANNSQEIILD